MKTLKTNFEEKTYESYFNNELANRSNVYFPLGQVQEGVIGLDSAGYSRSSIFWRALGFPFHFPRYPGANLREIADEMELFLKEIVTGIPKMKVNLLFQYKRCEYIQSDKAKEWPSWNKAYFRYDIYKKQQNLLDHLESKFGKRALIIYAAPAIIEVDELVNTYCKKKIIENSNFKKASELSGHRRNTFIQAGNYSIACSDPEEIMDFNLLDLIKETDSGLEEENSEFIIQTRKTIVSSIEGFNEFKLISKILEELEWMKANPLLYSFVFMRTFNQLTGIQWVISTRA